MIQHNISAPSAVLDFPTRERSSASSRPPVRHRRISGIIVNIWKVREMCRLVRQHSPQSEILVGGHVTAVRDRTVRRRGSLREGEGIAWMREYLGEDPAQPIRHPPLASSFGFA